MIRRLLFSKNGQNTLEYALLIVVLVVALMAMSIYGKRALKGNLASRGDDIGKQFDPLNTTYTWTDINSSQQVEITGNDGTSNTYMGVGGHGVAETTTRSGEQVVAPWRTVP